MNCAQFGCPSPEPGSRACHCAGCHRTFSNLTLFDAHQQWDREGAWSLACKDPGALGLVRAGNEVWWTPEALQALTEKVTKMNQARAA